jgi:aspartate aminotransferase
MLERASAEVGHRIFLLSDEPYRRLRFDGRDFTSPAALYPWTLISYSYGKVLLAPGQRLGYLAMSPLMPAADRHALSGAMFSTQMDLEKLSIDQAALARRRDRFLATLRKAGYSVLPPEGTFYLWSKWTNSDPHRQWSALADRDIFVLPGSTMNAPDYFRISLTASDEMVERALPAFAECV